MIARPNRTGPRGAEGLCRWLGGHAIALRPKQIKTLLRSTCSKRAKPYHFIAHARIGPRCTSSPPKNNLSTYLTKISRLGGYLGRANDSPPGNTVMWRGMSRLTDIALGFAIAAKLCG